MIQFSADQLQQLMITRITPAGTGTFSRGNADFKAEKMMKSLARFRKMAEWELVEPAMSQGSHQNHVGRASSASLLPGHLLWKPAGAEEFPQGPGKTPAYFLSPRNFAVTALGILRLRVEEAPWQCWVPPVT